jgi:hypothetical protein
MLIEDAIDDSRDDAYREGFEDGNDNNDFGDGGDGGGDW